MGRWVFSLLSVHVLYFVHSEPMSPLTGNQASYLHTRQPPDLSSPSTGQPTCQRPKAEKPEASGTGSATWAQPLGAHRQVPQEMGGQFWGKATSCEQSHKPCSRLMAIPLSAGPLHSAGRPRAATTVRSQRRPCAAGPPVLGAAQCCAGLVLFGFVFN